MNPETPSLPEEINIDRFKELSDGDAKSFVELVELYISKTSEQIRELEKAFSHQAFADIARIAHSMIGANAMVGMTSLLPILRRLEEHGEQQVIPLAKKDFQEVSAEFHKIHDSLNKHRDAFK